MISIFCMPCTCGTIHGGRQQQPAAHHSIQREATTIFTRTLMPCSLHTRNHGKCMFQEVGRLAVLDACGQPTAAGPSVPCHAGKNKYSLPTFPVTSTGPTPPLYDLAVQPHDALTAADHDTLDVWVLLLLLAVLTVLLGHSRCCCCRLLLLHAPGAARGPARNCCVKHWLRGHLCKGAREKGRVRFSMRLTEAMPQDQYLRHTGGTTNDFYFITCLYTGPVK